MAEKTKICCFDVKDDIIAYLENDHEVYKGSLGTRVIMTENPSKSKHIVPNEDLPPRLHEYDVFIIDMASKETKPYHKEDYKPLYNETEEELYVYCAPSLTVFNPKPYGAYQFFLTRRAKRDKKPIIIVFQDERIQREYRWCNQNDYHKGEESHSNYDFAYMPQIRNLRGKQVRLVDDNMASEILFKNYLNEVEYFCTFDCFHLSREEYLPLLVNLNGECVSYIQNNKDALIFMLPQMSDKAAFLKHLFEDFIYEQCSEYFPSIEEKNWIHHEEYMLPNEKQLYDELKQAYKEYEAKKAEIEKRIEENAGKYAFLQTLITGTGDELVDAMIEYLNWLGFKNVEKADDDGGELKEEDIRIPIPDGMFLLEVKGIKHNSTDEECRQVGKYKSRKMEDTGLRNIKALYVVNHQRNIEPLKRANPPFEPQQIKDAIYERRGILTTWRLYNLYYDIEKGVITKDEAREEIMQYGLVTFGPQGVVEIGKPTRYFKGNVICVDLDGQRVAEGDDVFASDGKNWHKAEVLSMEINNQRYKVLDKGDVGMMLSEDLPHNKVVYVRHKEEM